MFKKYKEEKGFTLLEILLVVALIAVLAGLILVALKPAQRIRQMNDTKKQTDTASILSAVYQYTIDNIGSMPVTLVAGSNYVIGTEATEDACLEGTLTGEYSCPAVTQDGDCVDLSSIVTDGYLSDIPVNPGGVTGGVIPTSTYSDAFTGYWISQAANGTLTVGSCDNDIDGENILTQR